jgi:dTMP kinase
MCGIFISFEGSEGCGKSTQVRLLAERFTQAGREVVTTREPGGTSVGEQIRHLLQFSKEGHSLVPEAELLLFAASRAQLVREVIAPALQAGKVVIADRFLDSTTVYQGVARRLAVEEVSGVNQFAVGGCLPDITLVFDVDPETARIRLMRRPKPAGAPDRMESQPPEFYEAVRAGYLALAEREMKRVVLVDARGTQEAVQGDVLRLLDEKLGLSLSEKI